MTTGADEPWDPIGPPGPRVKRPKRVPHFLRPKQPHDWRWVVGGIGKTLITLGLLMFAFVGYQLWGTGIQTARAQNDLRNDFQRQLEATTTVTPATTALPVTTLPGDTVVETTTTIPTSPITAPIDSGQPIATIRIEKIGVDKVVVEDTGVADLKNGPGHFRGTPMPGELGNSAIAGHRTTYGAPFGELDELVPGDLIEVTTLAGQYVYSVTGSLVVNPDEANLIIPTIDPTIATLTLVTCTPEYTSAQRLAVQAVLVPELSGQVYAPAPAQPVTPDTLPPEETVPSTTPDGTTPSGTSTTLVAPTTTVAPADAEAIVDDDAFSQGWFSDTAAIPHALGWGFLLFLVGLGAYFVGKAAKRL
ncbi:MAG: sortase, partial [Ilumatobacteraceae bacterium]